MSDCHELRPLLGAYVLGALDESEAARVRAHVAQCAECAAEHARLAPLPGLLTLASGAEAVADDPPSPALEERLLDAVAREAPVRRRRRPRRLRRPRLRVLAFAGAGAAAVAVAVVLLIGAVREEEGYGVAFRPAASVPSAGARAELEAVPGGTTVHLWVRGLPAEPGTVYEVLCDAPGWTASAGTFRVDANGKAYVVLTTAARRGQYDAIRVVRRTRDASGRARSQLVLSASIA